MVWIKAQSLTKDRVQSIIRVRGHCDQDQDSVCKLDWDSVYDLDQILFYVQVRILHVTNHV